MLTTMPITMAAICGWFGQIALAPPKNHVPSPAANPIKVAATELVVEVFNEISHSSIQVCAPSLSPGPSNLTCRNTISPGNRVSRILVAPTRHHATSAQDGPGSLRTTPVNSQHPRRRTGRLQRQKSLSHVHEFLWCKYQFPPQVVCIRSYPNRGCPSNNQSKHPTEYDGLTLKSLGQRLRIHAVCSDR